MPAFHQLQAEFGECVELVGVYITEAHAVDEWPISSARYTPDRQPVCIRQPRSTAERCVAARSFQAAFDFRLPLVVDTVDNAFDAVFAPWPLRFYILRGARLLYKAQPRNCSYSVEELRQAIAAAVGGAGSDQGGSGGSKQGEGEGHGSDAQH